MTSTQPTGMKAFIFIWVGQVVSLLGSGMTQFALTIWAYLGFAVSRVRDVEMIMPDHDAVSMLELA